MTVVHQYVGQTLPQDQTEILKHLLTGPALSQLDVLLPAQR